MSSGVKVNPAVKDEYLNLQSKHRYGYLVFALSPDHKEVIVDKIGDKGASFDEFRSYLIECSTPCGNKMGEARYGIFDLVAADDVGKNNAPGKLCFCSWVPDSLSIKQKMLYTTTLAAVKQALGTGIAEFIQANDEEELTYEKFADKIFKK